MELTAEDLTRLHDRYPFTRLSQQLGGVVNYVSILPREELGVPIFTMFNAVLGHLGMTFPQLGRDLRGTGIGGAGADEDPDLAFIRAVAEGAERYATCVLDDAEVVVASADELGCEALDLSTLPTCSERELRDPRCAVYPADPSKPIRWIPGYSLIDACERFVPVVMTHLCAGELSGEQFWTPISTGVAAHTSLQAAVVAAICEIVERDAIAITWLARLALPRIVFDGPVPEHHAVKFERLAKSRIRQIFFDATSDVGVPTVYALQIQEGHPHISQFVSCSTDFDATAACAKVIREAACGRTMFQYARDIPERTIDFTQLEDGAAYMGRPEQRGDFDFLLNTPNRRCMSEVQQDLPRDDSDRLRFLVDRFRDLGMDVVIVDLTTDELREAGLWVVRAVIPEMMPMTFIQRARFLGHARLYEYPLRAGYGRISEDDVNPAPQPFA